MTPVLKSLCLDLGPDLAQWPHKDQRAAVLELIERDQDWFSDAMSDFGVRRSAWDDVKHALTERDDITRLLNLGNLLDNALRAGFVLDALSRTCEENIYAWREQERQALRETA